MTVVSIDASRACPVCGTPFAFTTKEKRHWRETFSPLGLDFHTSSIPCHRCRRERRAERARETQLGKAVERVKQQPDDSAALLALARVTAESALTSESVDLDRAIAAARRARRIKPKLHEALYWEAVCHDWLAEHRRRRRSTKNSSSPPTLAPITQ